MRFRHCAAMFLVLASILGGGRATAQEAESFDLFTEAAERDRGPLDEVPGIDGDRVEAITYFALTPTASRSIRSSNATPRRMRIALPERDPVTCSFPAQPDAPAAPGEQVLLNGTVAGDLPEEHCDLVVDDGKIVGHIELETGRYRIVPVGARGDHAVVKIRTREFPSESDPRKRSDAGDRQRTRALGGEACDVTRASGPKPRAFGPIRVMILYTPAAKAMSANINADIALLMSQLRKSFSAPSTGGNFSVMVELAHAQEIAYSEAQADDMGGDLERLSNPQDPYFQSIPALREKYRADLVHLLIKSRPNDGCGIGWFNGDIQPWDADHGFSVSDIECAVDNYSFVHELGHNLGMNHDRAVVDDADQNDTNYGYVLLDQGVRSVMAYNNACTQRNRDCRRLPIFSTPRLAVAGVPIGSADTGGAYNVETLCKAAAIAAGFRAPSIFAVYESNDVGGKEISRLKGVDQRTCAAMCADNGQCKAYSYDKWNKWCFLKSTVGRLRIEPRAISGVLPELGEPARSSGAVDMERYRGKHFPGRGYSAYRAESSEACESICRGDAHCTGYTHYKAEKRCEIFASLGEYFSRADTDSGTKVQRAAAGDE